MSTTVTVRVAAAADLDPDPAIAAAFAEIARLELLLSEWREGSEVAAVNQGAGRGPTAVGDELFELLERARDVSVASEGAFDITVGALWGAWDFRWGTARIPSDAELARRLRLIDWRRVVLADRAVTLPDPEMRVTLGGIAKGYAVDRASAVLSRRGLTDHLVVAGGDLVARGTKLGRPWRIGIRDPHRWAIYATLDLRDEGVATSGNYERFFVRDGVRYHHLLDPATGRPARGLAAVTTRAANATAADAYSTAVFVLGAARGVALARRTPGVEALVWEEDGGAVLGTEALKARIRPLADSEPDAVIAPGAPPAAGNAP